MKKYVQFKNIMSIDILMTSNIKNHKLKALPLHKTNDIWHEDPNIWHEDPSTVGIVHKKDLKNVYDRFAISVDTINFF